jgi:hypothetical protein
VVEGDEPAVVLESLGLGFGHGVPPRVPGFSCRSVSRSGRGGVLWWRDGGGEAQRMTFFRK